jgi:uncharacterized secreted protein with C-terminal beta-propeller domain
MRTTKLLRSIALPAALLSAVACGSESSDDSNVGEKEDGGTQDQTTDVNQADDTDATDQTDTDDTSDNETSDNETTDSTTNEPVSPMGDPDKGVFESSNPSTLAGASGGRDVAVEDGASGGVSGAPTPAPTAPSAGDGEAADPNTPATPEPGEPPPDDSPERAIEEADVVKREGDRLYALSALGGLTIVDISDPDALKILGRHRSTATPFEMYVRDEVVFVLYNGYAEYLYDEETQTYTYYQTSYVVPLDTTDPEAITEGSKFEVSGYIADSRLVGDVMYVVAYDDGYCYRCGETPATHVMSLDVSDPQNVSKVDQLEFEDRLDEYSWGRSLSGNDERLYIAGPRYGAGTEPEGSIIQVVDIADASGDMKEGASLEVAGQINSRWQMDEHEGVLRVVSQPLWWWNEITPPKVETFAIESSDELTALGSTSLTLPEAETLQAVRFDGPRAYAITFRQTDPLFTIDLSDPANPAQMGELMMPGFVWHMEPRGDRLIGLGFDQGNVDGGLTVSLFDVSDLTAPTMIDRVNFGGQWGTLAEDQNRIHKSFQVLDSEELILIPFAGQSYTQTDTCTLYEYLSGVQLVNFADDELTLAGVAESQGLARRALLHKERLLTMSDERLESFDIADRDAPKSTSQVSLAQIVNQLDVSGDAVVRLGTDYWTRQGAEVTVSSLEDLVNMESGVTVELPDLNTQECNSYTYLERTLIGDERIYYIYRSYNYDVTTKSDEIRVTTLDVSDVENPSVVGDASLGFAPQYQYNYVPGMVDNGQGGVAVGNSLVFTNHTIERNDLGFITKNESTLEVVDFSDPAAPLRNSVELPVSLGSTSLLKSGNIVATSHFVTSPTNADNVRFYLDRIDLTDASAPVVQEPVNIPGSLLAYDADSGRALTLDYRYVEIDNISPKQCYEEEFGTFATENASWTSWEDDRGLCSAIRFTLHLVSIEDDVATLVGSHPIDKGIYINTAAIGDDRVFIGTNYGNIYYWGVTDGPIAQPAAPPVGDAAIGGRGIGYGYYSFGTGDATLLVASGLSGGSLTVATMDLEVPEGSYGISGLVAKGKRAVVAAGWQGKMSVIDASDATAPEVTGSIQLPSYVSDLDLVGNTAVAALGAAGVQTISLE